jgi:hypothetical protein
MPPFRNSKSLEYKAIMFYADRPHLGDQNNPQESGEAFEEISGPRTAVAVGTRRV